MIRIEKVNKYFNRHKKNQIHVINDTSLTLGDTGLVALLGASGSGKTTLLNVIGGLDKVRTGKIYINDKKITSRFSHRVDKIRNLNIGYIFQDYKLVENLSVYDNVALSLKIIGIKDKKEIDKRVSYVLQKVGMYRYRKRPANMLSGGERQRVGIARAIVKNPNIIIADEPTGNLDSKNSVEIMNIIKAISKDRLVILVTHEVNLANFYASRIIEISDGKVVNDYENTHTNELDYAIDNRFYLKDFKEQEEYKVGKHNVVVYHDKDEKLNVEIVIKNNNIYIKTKDDRSIEVVDEDSSVEFINDHYRKMDKNDIEKYEFDFEDIIDKKKKLRYSSIFNPISFITNGFIKVFNYSVIKKILLIGFFASAIFIMTSVSMIAATREVKENDFVTVNKNYLTMETDKVSLENYNKYNALEGINYLLPGESIIKLKLVVKDYYQTSKHSLALEGSLASTSMLKKEDLIYGRLPEKDDEIVVDKMSISRLYKENPTAKMVNLQKIKDMLNREVSIQNMKNFTIVGITDLKSPSIYANDALFTNILYNNKQQGEEYAYSSDDNSEMTSGIQDYNLFSDKIYLTKGRIPENDYEVIVNAYHQEEMKLNTVINTKLNGRKLIVVGFYDSANSYDLYLVNNNTINIDLITKTKSITISTNDKEKTLNNIRDNFEVNVYDNYQKDRDNYTASRQKQIDVMLIFSYIILAISLVEIFLISRSSFLSRVKEVGVYRAIGVKKKDIYIMFAGEVIAITTLASLSGIILCAYILNILEKVPGVGNYLLINLPVILIAIIIVYGFNLLVGLLPVFNVLRKRPAQILAGTDVD